MIRDPQQELFTCIRTTLNTLYPNKVYDSELPALGTAYPFIYLGDSLLIDQIHKQSAFGNVTQTIHVWSDNPKNRGTLSEMLYQIKLACKSITGSSFKWDVINVRQQIAPDNSTDVPLLHAVLEIEFRFG